MFRIKITKIIIITKTLSTIDDDIRSNVTLHTYTYRTCHDHLQFTSMNEIPTLFWHPTRNTSHCLWLERKYSSDPFYLITEIFTSSSPRPQCALNGPLSSRTHLPWTFSHDAVLHAASAYHRQNRISLVSYQQLPCARSWSRPIHSFLSSCIDLICHFKSTHHDHHDVAPCAAQLLELNMGWDGSLHELILPSASRTGRQASRQAARTTPMIMAGTRCPSAAELSEQQLSSPFLTS